MSRGVAADPIGWFIGTLHQLIGHDATAAVIEAAPGDKADSIALIGKGVWTYVPLA